MNRTLLLVLLAHCFVKKAGALPESFLKLLQEQAKRSLGMFICQTLATLDTKMPPFSTATWIHVGGSKSMGPRSPMHLGPNALSTNSQL